MTSKNSLAKVDHVGKSVVPGVLSALLSLTSDGVLVLDAAGRIITANSQVQSMTGMAPQELFGMDVNDLLRDHSRRSPISAPDGMASLPLVPDGSLASLSMRLAAGGAATVVARADRVSGPGETYVVVIRPADAAMAAEREHDRLLNELSLANRRLSGTLKIVLDTIDAQDVETLFSEVLEQMTETLEAGGAVLFLAETTGYRQLACTRSLANKKTPQFMAYGEGLETIVTRAGSAMRLRLLPPSERSLRSGALTSRELLDEDSGAKRRIPARQTPPFTSFVCVPVWFGGHVIAIIEVGWSEAHPTRRDDARLLDSVAQYLSVEFAAALSTMRAQRAQRLDAAATRIHELVEDSSEDAEKVQQGFVAALEEELQVRLAPIHSEALSEGCVVQLPLTGDVELPYSVDELVEGRVDAGIAVVPAPKGSRLATWLAKTGSTASGVLLDLGEIAGVRRSFIVLRSADQEPIDEAELDFLRRVAIDVRQEAEEGERRNKDTRIAQALQSGMKSELQQVEGITAHGLYSSATAAALVGGDFYDLVRLPNRRACVILGDVSGKGVEAASVSAAVRTALGAYAWEGQPPARMVRLLNDFLLGFSRLETFATLFVGVADLRKSTLTYCSAGHPPAIFLHAKTGEMETLDEQSGVVGAFRGMTYHDGHVKLEQGDRILLYTDGVTEARNPAGAFFGEQGLRDAVMEEAAGDYDTLLDRLLARIDAFTERSLDDDVAMVTLRFDALGPSRARKG